MARRLLCFPERGFARKESYSAADGDYAVIAGGNYPRKEARMISLQANTITVMLNLFQHLTTGETLKQVQGDNALFCIGLIEGRLL